MKPNDEALESNLPEEPLPEPDALLDALVDAETEAAPRRRTSKTLIAALVLSGLGIWQIVHVNNGGEPLFQLAPKAKSAPTKLRSDGRVPIGKVLPSTDPIAAYLERAKRGMTDHEIRWMIEDFMAAKLDRENATGVSEGLALRKRQSDWYLNALADGLNLSTAQKLEAAAKIQRLIDEDWSGFREAMLDTQKKNDFLMGRGSINDPINPVSWLTREVYAPWNLCDLSQEQSRLTLHHWKSEAKQTDLKTADTDNANPLGTNVFPTWIETRQLAIQDPNSGNLLEFPEAGETNDTFLFYDETRFSGVVPISDVFPLTLDQKLADHRRNIVDQLRLLQPAQLRMVLLLEPFAAEVFSECMDPGSTRNKEIPVVEGGVLPESSDDNDPDKTESSDLPKDDGTNVVIPDSTEKDPPEAVSPPLPETPVDPLPEPDSK